ILSFGISYPAGIIRMGYGFPYLVFKLLNIGIGNLRKVAVNGTYTKKSRCLGKDGKLGKRQEEGLKGLSVTQHRIRYLQSASPCIDTSLYFGLKITTPHRRTQRPSKGLKPESSVRDLWKFFSRSVQVSYLPISI